MKMTINYQMHYWPDGTVYRQFVKIDEELQKKYNEALDAEYKRIRDKEKSEHIISWNDMYFQVYTFKLKKWINYTHLTWFYKFCEVAYKNWLDMKRLLSWRNTIIKVL